MSYNRLLMTDYFSIHTKYPTGNLSFDLQVRNMEIKAMEKVLLQVQKMKTKERRAWIEQNGMLMSVAYEKLLNEANYALQSLPLDSEVLKLSQQLITNLRDTSELLDGLLPGDIQMT